MLALSLKEKKQEEKQQNRRQQATAFALNKSSNKTVDKAPADRTYIAVVCAPLLLLHPPCCVREWLRACVLCLSVWESESLNCVWAGACVHCVYALRLVMKALLITTLMEDNNNNQQQQGTTTTNNDEAQPELAMLLPINFQ